MGRKKNAEQNMQMHMSFILLVFPRRMINKEDKYRKIIEQGRSICMAFDSRAYSEHGGALPGVLARFYQEPSTSK